MLISHMCDREEKKNTLSLLDGIQPRIGNESSHMKGVNEILRILKL